MNGLLALLIRPSLIVAVISMAVGGYRATPKSSPSPPPTTIAVERVDPIEYKKLKKSQLKPVEPVAPIPEPKPQPVAQSAQSTAPQQAYTAPSGGFLSGCGALQQKMAEMGYSPAEINAAINIATHESGCRQIAQNPTSGACNVFQEYPCGKWGGQNNLEAHIRGAGNYANAVYGGWVGAWATWQSQHWW